ncbi:MULTISPECIES: DUF1206 domain-containing protein [unclassified Leisingera]|uniref:DUF1206 domain-containing protein n=1 Tax=unclassified Leisingera TaxID=2614906 RepID=UPI00030544EF|nr:MULTISPECIES: DUF1206 domain-containing protein [unclassified Leisingera]KIC23100.1 membrane protein [Leisingera sp. ANG-S3]KIC23736.1 membrane protein [Leisingera sp. ANG-M6]KIC52319.1 membrane protein [Leisingera sp. ANG-S]KID09504.1 membrane protein [Leisingera sp. ANG1]
MPQHPAPPESRRDDPAENSARGFAWAVPLMRAGYAGRGLVYLLVGGASLWSIWHGGSAEGTGEAMGRLQGALGTAILLLIALGMAAYAIWRAVDSIWDLEDYGNSPKGLIARAGMITTGLVHLGLSGLAITVLLGRSEGLGKTELVNRLLASPGGQAAAGIAGALTLGAGGYYLHKAWSEGYRDHMQGNPATLHLNLVLKAGMAAHGVVIAIIGFLMMQAAAYASSHEAGGIGTAFNWLQDKTYGQILVTFLCIGLLGFSLVCFVNAAWRIVPKADDRGLQTLKDMLNS